MSVEVLDRPAPGHSLVGPESMSLSGHADLVARIGRATTASCLANPDSLRLLEGAYTVSGQDVLASMRHSAVQTFAYPPGHMRHMHNPELASRILEQLDGELFAAADLRTYVDRIVQQIGDHDTRYGTAIGNDPTLALDATRLYLQDIASFEEQGFPKPEAYALHHDPGFPERLRQQFADDPIVQPSIVNLYLKNHVKDPAKAIHSYKERYLSQRSAYPPTIIGEAAYIKLCKKSGSDQFEKLLAAYQDQQEPHTLPKDSPQKALTHIRSFMQTELGSRDRPAKAHFMELVKDEVAFRGLQLQFGDEKYDSIMDTAALMFNAYRNETGENIHLLPELAKEVTIAIFDDVKAYIRLGVKAPETYVRYHAARDIETFVDTLSKPTRGQVDAVQLSREHVIARINNESPLAVQDKLLGYKKKLGLGMAFFGEAVPHNIIRKVANQAISVDAFMERMSSTAAEREKTKESNFAERMAAHMPVRFLHKDMDPVQRSQYEQYTDLATSWAIALALEGKAPNATTVTQFAKCWIAYAHAHGVDPIEAAAYTKPAFEQFYASGSMVLSRIHQNRQSPLGIRKRIEAADTALREAASTISAFELAASESGAAELLSNMRYVMANDLYSSAQLAQTAGDYLPMIENVSVSDSRAQKHLASAQKRFAKLLMMYDRVTNEHLAAHPELVEKAFGAFWDDVTRLVGAGAYIYPERITTYQPADDIIKRVKGHPRRKEAALMVGMWPKTAFERLATYDTAYQSLQDAYGSHQWVGEKTLAYCATLKDPQDTMKTYLKRAELISLMFADDPDFNDASVEIVASNSWGCGDDGKKIYEKAVGWKERYNLLLEEMGRQDVSADPYNVKYAATDFKQPISRLVGYVRHLEKQSRDAGLRADTARRFDASDEVNARLSMLSDNVTPETAYLETIPDEEPTAQTAQVSTLLAGLPADERMVVAVAFGLPEAHGIDAKSFCAEFGIEPGELQAAAEKALTGLTNKATALGSLALPAA